MYFQSVHKMQALACNLLVTLLSALVLQASKNDLEPRGRTREVVNLSEDEVKKYDSDPTNCPRLDHAPRGTVLPHIYAGQTKNLTTRIIGGSKAVQKQIPWQVWIRIDSRYLCGGSLISQIWVLTAAHCAYGFKTFEITAGGVTRNSIESGEIKLISTIAVIHENYNIDLIRNDIALIKLPTALTINDYIRPVRLPRTSDAKKTFQGTTATVSGYGMTNNVGLPSQDLMYVKLQVIKNTVCAKVYGTIIVSSMICTAASSSKGTCSGDSGGPLTIQETDGKQTIIGIVSFTAATSCTNYPAGYTRVTSFLGWISKKTGLAIAN